MILITNRLRFILTLIVRNGHILKDMAMAGRSILKDMAMAGRSILKDRAMAGRPISIAKVDDTNYNHYFRKRTAVATIK